MIPRVLSRAALLLMLVVGTVACSSREDRIATGLRRSADHIRLADWDKASVELANVLQIDPKNAQGWRLSGQVAENRLDWRRAFGAYTKALEIDPADIEAKLGLARIYLAAGQADKADALAAQVEGASPNHAGARTLEAAALASRGDIEGAIALATAVAAAASAPPPDTAMLLAALHRQRGNLKAAMAAIDGALAADPHHVGLLRVGALLASSLGDDAGAQQAVDLYRRAVKEAPRNASVWVAWAQHHAARGELAEAERVLRTWVQAQPDDSARLAVLLDFLRDRRGADVAEHEYLAAIAAHPRDPALRFGLVALYRASARPDDARRVLEEVAEGGTQNPAALSARTQLAADLLASGRIEAARTRLEQVLSANPRDGPALVLRGRIRLAQGDATGAIEDLRAATRDQPTSHEVVGLLAQAHHRAGEAQLAREVLADAVRSTPQSVELRLLLAADLADAHEYAAAASEADQAIRLAPRDLRAYDFKAQLADAQHDGAAAEAVYVAYKTRFADDPAGPIRLADLYARERRYESALRELDLAQRLAPGQPGPVRSAVALLTSRHRFEEASARIDAYEKRGASPPVTAELRADVADARGDAAAAKQALEHLIEVAPSESAGYLRLARLRAREGRFDEALGVLGRGERALPASVVLSGAHAEMLVRAGRPEEAIVAYESLLASHPDDDAVANNLAYLLVDRKGDPASVERALSITRRFEHSRNPSYLDSLGWTYYRSGRYADAVGALERAVARQPDAALFQLHLGLALHKAGSADQAEAHLRAALDSPIALPGIEEARELLARR